jgi:hypothetical protein
MTLSRELLSSVASAFSAGTPYLKALDLEMQTVLASSKPPVLLSPPMNAAKLRILRLKSCALDWSHAQLLNLTELSLTGILTEAEKISTHQLLTVLGQSPQLEILCLEDAIRQEVNTQSTYKRPLLSHLNTLTLFSTDSAIATLIIGPGPFHNLKTLDLKFKKAEKQAMFSILAVVTSFPQFQCPTSIAASMEHIDGRMFFAYSHVCRDIASPHILLVKNSWDPDPEDILDFPRFVYNSVTKAELQQLRGFEYKADRLPSAQWWIGLFERMDGLQLLSVKCNHDLDGIVEALTPNDPHDDCHDPNENGPPRRFLLPQLDQLTLLCDLDYLYVSPLAHCMELRSKNGASLSSLELPGFTSDYEDLFEFQEEGTVSGIEGRYRYEDTDDSDDSEESDSSDY